MHGGNARSGQGRASEGHFGRGPRGATRVDARGCYLVPGLVDAHVHLEHGNDAAILSRFVAIGVTTVRNMDGRPYILEWKRRVALGELLGPTIYTAGPILDGDPRSGLVRH